LRKTVALALRSTTTTRSSFLLARHQPHLVPSGPKLHVLLVLQPRFERAAVFGSIEVQLRGAGEGSAHPVAVGWSRGRGTPGVVRQPEQRLAMELLALPLAGSLMIEGYRLAPSITITGGAGGRAAR